MTKVKILVNDYVGLDLGMPRFKAGDTGFITEPLICSTKYDCLVELDESKLELYFRKDEIEVIR